VLMQRFPDYCGRLRLGQRLLLPTLAEEDKQYNVDHDSIGYLVARHWKLPDFVCQAILYHHEMPHEEHGAVRTLVAHAATGDPLLPTASAGSTIPVWHKLRGEVLSELGISPDSEQEYYDISASSSWAEPETARRSKSRRKHDGGFRTFCRPCAPPAGSRPAASH